MPGRPKIRSVCIVFVCLWGRCDRLDCLESGGCINGETGFIYYTSRLWNTLLSYIRYASTVDIWEKQLKTDINIAHFHIFLLPFLLLSFLRFLLDLLLYLLKLFMHFLIFFCCVFLMPRCKVWAAFMYEPCCICQGICRNLGSKFNTI